MSKVIKILVVVVVVLAAVVVWVKNPGDIRSKIMRTKAKAQKQAKKVMKTGKVTPESIEQAKQCREMLERIQRAKRAAEQKNPVGVDVTWENVLPLLNMKEIPRCPAGGTYKLNPSLQMPSCSIGNNSTVDTKDDHILYH